MQKCSRKIIFVQRAHSTVNIGSKNFCCIIIFVKIIFMHFLCTKIFLQRKKLITVSEKRCSNKLKRTNHHRVDTITGKKFVKIVRKTEPQPHKNILVPRASAHGLSLSYHFPWRGFLQDSHGGVDAKTKLVPM